MSGTSLFPFAELPESLVEQVLAKSERIGEDLHKSLLKIKDAKKEMRRQLEEAKLLRKDVDLGETPVPTTCGIDGSFAVEKLLSMDLVACAAVAIEGLIPPSEKKSREKPDHQVFIRPEKHDAETGNLIRGLMAEMEIDLAESSKNDVVFMDGSLGSRIIHLNQAFSKVRMPPETETEVAMVDGLYRLLKNYKKILESKADAGQPEQQWVSVPKYTTRGEIGSRFNWPSDYDDRAIMTIILTAGEFTTPVKLTSDKDNWHLKLPYPDEALESLRDEIEKAMDGLRVMYYKPNTFSPAMRIEIPESVAMNDSRLAIVLCGLKYQCSNPAIFEPYPLYMADRMVKHLPSALPAFRQTATRKMAELTDGDLTEIFFSMQSYRTE